jgi:hypothetical protein
MTKLIYPIALLAIIFLFNCADAQVSVSVNIGFQPVWGPVGYDYVDYYYMPDVEAYYYVPRHQFIYMERGAWITRTSLPARYAKVNLYQTYKVVINEPTPYKHHDVYKAKYVSYKGQGNQAVIRDSHDSKYFVIKNHPEHAKWKAEPQHGIGNPSGSRGNETHREQSPHQNDQGNKEHAGGNAGQQNKQAPGPAKGQGHDQHGGGGHHKN